MLAADSRLEKTFHLKAFSVMASNASYANAGQYIQYAGRAALGFRETYRAGLFDSDGYLVEARGLMGGRKIEEGPFSGLGRQIFQSNVSHPLSSPLISEISWARFLLLFLAATAMVWTFVIARSRFYSRS